MPPNDLPNAPSQTSVAADLNEVRAATVAANLKAAKVRAAKVNSGLVARVREMAAREEARDNA